LISGQPPLSVGAIATAITPISLSGVPSNDVWAENRGAAMLTPDTETRMLIACYLHGDLSIHDLRRQIMKLAWRLDALDDHPLTSKAILYLHDHGFSGPSTAEMTQVLADLLEEARPSRSPANA
jgi:hypothetical protein